MGRHYMEPGQDMPWVGPKPEGVQYQRIHYGGGDGRGSEAHSGPGCRALGGSQKRECSKSHGTAQFEGKVRTN